MEDQKKLLVLHYEQSTELKKEVSISFTLKISSSRKALLEGYIHKRDSADNFAKGTTIIINR